MITHVAFIMDGNRRWARERGLPTFFGHRKGYLSLEKIINHAYDRGIKHLTFWAFSTENWSRDTKEVSYLLNLFRRALKGKMIHKLLRRGGKIQLIGDLSAFPKDIQEESARVEDISKDNSAITINIALNYGGRAEIAHAVKKIISEGINEADITTELISQYLYTNDQPDPDMIIRTGGEKRLSGYLPWQSVYSELYFTKTYWPDFDEKEFDKAIEEFQDRQRRFGK